MNSSSSNNKYLFCARICRPSFHENKPKTLVFSHTKRAFWSCFRENWVYNFGHWCLMSSLTFPTRFRWKNIGELTFIRDISNEFLCSPPHVLLVHWLNSWFLVVRFSCSNLFFQIAKRPFDDRGERVKYVCGPLEYGMLVNRTLLSVGECWRVLTKKYQIIIISRKCFPL
jgi:hypothetical protein